jgi:prevent-host-death family protein
LRTVDIAEAKGSLSEYVREAEAGPLVLTRRGRPVAAVVSIHGVDMESLSLSTNPEFIALVERSRASYKATGGVSLEDIRKKRVIKPARKRVRRKR